MIVVMKRGRESKKSVKGRKDGRKRGVVIEEVARERGHEEGKKKRGL